MRSYDHKMTGITVEELHNSTHHSLCIASVCILAWFLSLLHANCMKVWYSVGRGSLELLECQNVSRHIVSEALPLVSFAEAFPNVSRTEMSLEAASSTPEFHESMANCRFTSKWARATRANDIININMRLYSNKTAVPALQYWRASTALQQYRSVDQLSEQTVLNNPSYKYTVT